MVKKMKLKLWLCCFLLTIYSGTAFASASSDAGLYFINNRGVVRCGTPSDNKIFAYKDEEGKWQGISPEICRIISTAIFGRSDRIKMVFVPETMVSDALSTNKIDVMIGGMPYSATNESSTKAAPVAPIYYDRMVFLARDAAKAKSMKDFQGEKVCIVDDIDDLSRLNAFNDKHQLNFKIMNYKLSSQARESFLLKRCRLFVGNAMLLQDMLLNTPSGMSGVEMLPETIDTRPFYLYTDKANTTLRSALKWIMNATKLAEEVGLTQDNYTLNLATKDISMRNLLGIDDKLWNRFKLEPTWVQTLLKERGHYGDVFENTLGSKSRFNLKRGKNHLLKNGGMMFSEEFL